MRKTDKLNDGGVAGQQPNLVVLCLLGLCVSLATWGALQWKYPYFTVAEEFSIGMGASNEDRDALQAEQARVNRLNAAVVFGVAGALLAGGLAFFAQTCCGLVVRILTALIGGGVWGGATGFVGATLYASVMPTESLPGPTSIGFAQALVFALFGAGIGLLFAMFSRNKSQILTAVFSGAGAGAAGGMLYPIVASLAFPSEGTTDFIAPASSVRLLWLSLPLVAIAAAVPVMCAKQRNAPQDTAES